MNESMNESRLAALRARMRELEVDTFMVSQPENRRYVSGFTGSAGIVFVTQSAAKLATDFRYYEQVKQQSPDFDLVEATGRLEQFLPGILGELQARRVAFEADAVIYDTYQSYAAAMPDGVELVATKEVVRWLRAVKDDAEIAALQRAVALADSAMDTLRAMLRPGMTEKEVAWKLEQEMRQAGAAKLSFDIICAAGRAGAMSHAVPTDRPIRAGEPIVIDMGCMVDGYCSDLTRTLIIGEPDAQFREIYDTVLRAQERAEAEITPGMGGKAAHEIAAGVIGEAGYGPQFGHGLGHGVGLAIHELPNLSPLSEHTLQPGHVFSVEPGIYLPEWGGVRIEDMVVLEEAGVRILTQTSKDPVVPLP
jgi:Xaa-Pro aminopeptidase